MDLVSGLSCAFWEVLAGMAVSLAKRGHVLAVGDVKGSSLGTLMTHYGEKTVSG